jgi:hypothetical protein
MENLAAQISSINLQIDQGSLDAAERQAQEALQAHPNSATIHALMGDIAAARRDGREAIDWYELSLRLEPNPQVHARLERQREQLEAESEAEIDRLLERPRDQKQRRLILGVVGGLIVLGIVVALIASALSGRGPERRSAGRAGTPRPGAQAGAPAPQTPGAALPQAPGAPAVQPPVAGRPAASATPRPATGVPGPATQPPPAGVVRITERVEAPLSDRDRLMTQALSGMTWGTGEQLGWRVMALVDDFTGYALITVEVPPSVQRVALSDTVIDMAYKLAVAAIQADSGVQSLTVRVMAPVEVERRNVMLLAFRANTTRDHLDYYLKRGLQPDRETIWSHVFATTWWNPSVPSGMETGQ